MGKGILYSEGEVEITMNVPEQEQPTGRLMVDQILRRAAWKARPARRHTDRLATFQFDRGDGHAMGADYDPNTRELNMHNRGVDDLARNRSGHDPHEDRDRPAQLQRAECEGVSHAVVQADPRHVGDECRSRHSDASRTAICKLVETTQAKGTDQRPGRNLDYGANQLFVEFNDNNQIQKITGVDQARVVSTGETSQTTITSDRVVMDFETTGIGQHSARPP